MKPQNYDNHIQYYVAHHFVFYPLLLVFIGASITVAFTMPQYHYEFMGIAIVLFMIGWLSFMLRQHYALGNQNRIVRLEMRLRYFQLTAKRFDLLEPGLSFGQIAALRFASDGELPLLVQQTLDEKLSPDQVKQRIKDWQPDYMRV